MLIEGPNVGSSGFWSPEVTSNFISLLFDELEMDWGKAFYSRDSLAYFFMCEASFLKYSSLRSNIS